MIPVSSSPLENLAAFGLTFIVGVLAALSLTTYYRRVKGDASAYRCRYPPDPTPPPMGATGACAAQAPQREAAPS